MYLTAVLYTAMIGISLASHQYPLPHPHHLSGHGVAPNLYPSVIPAMESEEVGLLDLMKDGVNSLPNTWESRPNYRYPYYDSKGKGYLLYGYGGRELYEYSEFETLEGWY